MPSAPRFPVRQAPWRPKRARRARCDTCSTFKQYAGTPAVPVTQTNAKWSRSARASCRYGGKVDCVLLL
eukprot:2880471-Pyramimonas_sp.AAC.1